MSPALHVTLSMSLTMGIPLIWAVREWLAMRADLSGGGRPGPDTTPQPLPLPPELTPRRLPTGLVPPDYALTQAREAERV